ncbi:DNA/RNA non-specific endonuclease [Yersinia frederiksenii]|uniref:DNA/RNA non-specific endonuclease n=2 Tax=Yersinia frederiksenii TaxID=29484 RepID=A0A380PZM2_YERFR|nr:DNA/RNA non-specific endonuclease [Yersinia frederiksenii]ATM96659.1 DNA/RNA non-specific endonuclease [Yersinia frederiksenii]EEQ14692.1 DNA/RNA non-specific endonuclease [Yersinia frederiksenii ATCC 33641]KGA48213.1 nuclease [Yersinia frederiksenii ATCC 33641]SUP78988.1 DNA/RNA non-specific endonuclease [Yersinia frederiksenii]
MKLNIIKLLPVILLTACTATDQSTAPKTTLSAPVVSEQILATAAIDNCLVGCPTGGSSQTIIRNVYTLNNNSDTKFANWVAYKVTKNSQASKHKRQWAQDPDLPSSDTLAPADYTSANQKLAVDRGHQAPLSSLAGNVDSKALNYLSNITPQKAILNQGAWAKLEDKERALANDLNVTAVYSVTGPLFERNIGTLPAKPSVAIPSGYWKIIFIGTSPDKGQYAAFLMDQNTGKSANFCDYQVTVNTIEAKTNPQLTIWPNLPTDIAQIIKSQEGTLAKTLGCN